MGWDGTFFRKAYARRREKGVKQGMKGKYEAAREDEF